jgi:16S rRNA (uracil1498-N3)-methyltransferase
MRRIRVARAVVGRIELEAAQAHHLRDVLRMEVGAWVEVFDQDGATGIGRIVAMDSGGVTVEVEQIGHVDGAKCRLTMAVATPKAARADWMIEKLGELGVDAFVPIVTERTVVLPKGSSKIERWTRLARESARQSGRVGVMRIGAVTELPQLIRQAGDGGVALWHLSPSKESVSIFKMIPNFPASVMLLVGPEGGWTPKELSKFGDAGSTGVRLTRTILRVETAAIAAAAIIQAGLT